MKRRTRQKCYTQQTCINLFSAASIRNIFRSYTKNAHKCMQVRPSREVSVTAVRLLPKLGRLDAFLIKLSCNKLHANPCSSSRVFIY